MLVQAVVDHSYLFRDLCVGWPGSVHDARVLANSTLYKKVTSDDLLQGDKEQIGGQELGIYLIGDSAYPLSPWLIKPFAFSSSFTSRQKNLQLQVIQSQSSC